MKQPSSPGAKVPRLNAAQPLVLDPKDPMASARSFLRSRHEIGTGRAILRTLHHFNDDFYGWARTHYQVKCDDEIESDIWKFLETAVHSLGAQVVPFRPNRARVQDNVAALKALCHLDRATPPAAWIGGKSGPPPKEIVSCSNGLLHLSSRKLLRHTAAFFNLNAVTFPYDKAAPVPREWLEFLSSLWPNDTEAIATLQQVFGYLLTGDTAQQKAFLLIGPPRSGKGTLARVLGALLGEENVVNPTLGALANHFGLESLIGSRLAIISDARLGGRIDQYAILERLLSITGEDAQMIDRKYKKCWTGKLSTRFLVLTNELPQFTDASGAIANRFVILTLKNSFLGREDHRLIDRLLAELPGILAWAMEGLNDLKESGRFTMPTSSRDACQELNDLAGPLHLFIRSKCNAGPHQSVAVKNLYLVYRKWCDEVGLDRPGSEQTLGRALKAAIPNVVTKQRRGLSKVVERYYEGIGLQ